MKKRNGLTLGQLLIVLIILGGIGIYRFGLRNSSYQETITIQTETGEELEVIVREDEFFEQSDREINKELFGASDNYTLPQPYLFGNLMENIDLENGFVQDGGFSHLQLLTDQEGNSQTIAYIFTAPNQSVPDITMNVYQLRTTDLSMLENSIQRIGDYYVFNPSNFMEARDQQSVSYSVGTYPLLPSQQAIEDRLWNKGVNIDGVLNNENVDEFFGIELSDPTLDHILYADREEGVYYAIPSYLYAVPIGGDGVSLPSYRAVPLINSVPQT